MKRLQQRPLTRELLLVIAVKLVLLGWFVAKYGRQPWSIFGVLPTHPSVSTLSIGNLYGSLAGFIGFYTLLLVVELYLMFKFARLGPSSLGTGKYHFERMAA